MKIKLDFIVRAALVVCAVGTTFPPLIQAASPATDCPMAFQPYSSNTILFDLLLNPQTKAAFDRRAPTSVKKLPPFFLEPKLPSFATLITPRTLAPIVGWSETELAKLDADLAAIPVTSQAAAARCARYDQVPPALPENIKAPAILVFAKVSGFRHGEAIDAAAVALKAIGERNGWTVVFNDNAAVFNPQMLRKFKAVVWSNVSGDALTLTQQQAFRAYIEDGGGFAAFHGSGGDPFYPWKWYGDELIGAPFLGHPMSPQFQQARVVIEDPKDAIVRNLGGGWTMSDEWYSFKSSPRASGAHILATLDESSYSPMAGKQDLRMGDHPIAWKRCVRNGRSFYTAIGHRAESFSEANTIKLLERGIAWAAGAGETQCRDGREVGSR